MRKLLLVAAMLAASAGCNTIDGFGKDLQAIGKAVSGTAGDTKSGK